MLRMVHLCGLLLSALSTLILSKLSQIMLLRLLRSEERHTTLAYLNSFCHPLIISRTTELP